MTADTPDCQSDYDPHSLSLEQARARILDSLDSLDAVQSLPLAQAAQRVLAEAITAPRDVPPYRNSAMDGFACRRTDLPASGAVSLSLIGESLAGHAYQHTLGEQQAIRVTTGAVLPDNADVVIMQERCSEDAAQLHFDVADAQNTSFVRERGSDTRRGDTVMDAGKRLGPAQIAVLASLGVDRLCVYRPVRVAILSTGDELVEQGASPAPDQIFDSNRPALRALLQQPHIELIDCGICADNPDTIRQRLSDAATRADLIISSGGVSVGQADHLRAVLADIGQLNFWKISVKPGRPLTFGRIGRAHYFGLPGNPVSTLVTFQQLVEPALRKLAGETQHLNPIHLHAICETTLRKQAGRQEFQRGVLRQDPSGQLHVSATGAQDSHIISSMSQANCLIDLSAESTGAKVGETVKVQLL